MKISFRLLTGSRLGLVELSLSVPVSGENRTREATFERKQKPAKCGEGALKRMRAKGLTLSVADGGDAMGLAVLLQAQLLLVEVERRGIDAGALEVQSQPLAPLPPERNIEKLSPEALPRIRLPKLTR